MEERSSSVIEFTDLSEQDAQLIMAALAELPIKIAGPTYSKITKQFQAWLENGK